VKELTAFLAALIAGSLVSLTGCDDGPPACYNTAPRVTGHPCDYSYAGARLVVRGGALVCECPGRAIEVRP
jgi:hypothetical protein